MRTTSLIRNGLLAAAALAFTAPNAQALSYTVFTSPNRFTGNNILNAVSADGATDAWAVGELCCSARHFGRGTLTAHWNGASWSIVASPDTIFNDDVLNGVAAISPSDVWGVGFVKQSGFRSGIPLAIHSNGSAWSTASLPSGLTGSLRTTSADGSGDVWAVGDDAHGHPLVLRFNGTSWSQVAVPLVGTSNTIQGVKAFSPADVWLVGSKTVSGSSQGRTLVLHFDGVSWKSVPSPSPDPNLNLLHAVDGRSSSDLWAVGSKGLDEGSTGVTPGTRTLAMHWNGASWSVVPSDNTGDQDTLEGVSVLPGGAAAAVGSFNDTSGPIPIARTLAETFNGTALRRTPSPNVGTSDNLLRGAATLPGS